MNSLWRCGSTIGWGAVKIRGCLIALITPDEHQIERDNEKVVRTPAPEK
jgi:hypothetical protein